MKKHPILFEAVCIFSIIGSSIGFITMAIATFFFDSTLEEITAITNISAAERLSPLYFAIYMGLYCLSLVGAIRIYQQKLSGLLFYLAAQISILILPVIWLGSSAFSSTNTIFTTLFGMVYIMYFPHITKKTLVN